jgi:hypothetical protein
MRNGMSRWLLVVALLLLAGSVLTACTVSASGGIAGSIVSTLLLVFALTAVGTTQTGCETCLGACLSPLPEDVGTDEDTGDADVGPCLSFIDVGADTPTDADTGDSDVSPDATDAADSRDAEHLDAADTADAADSDAELGSVDPERRRILDKMRQRLPADVLEKLDDDQLA